MGGIRVAWVALALAGVAFGSSSGTVVLSSDGATLFVANPDSGTVSAVSTNGPERLLEITVGVEPRSLALSPDRQYLYVTDTAAWTLTVIDTFRAEVVAKIDTGAEPYGVVVDPRGERVYVAATAVDRVEVFSAFPNLERIGRMETGPRPKGLAISPDGARLYVTHFLSGDVSILETAAGAVVNTIRTGADSNMSQKIALHPTNQRAYLPMIRSNVVNRFQLFDGSVFPIVAVVDLAAGRHLSRARIDLSLGQVAASMPFDMAFSPDGRRAYVVSFGSGDLSVVDLGTGRRIARVDVGEGPNGLALSAGGRFAYVSNSLSEDLSVVDLDEMRETGRVRITDGPATAEVKRGRTLFFSSRSTRISRERWMNCGSCHFFGEHDGRTWITSVGIRNTTSLRGAGETKPLHWSADRNEFQDFEFTIRELQAGTGLLFNRQPNLPLGPSNAKLSPDLDALAAFIETLKTKRSPFQEDPDAIERGRVVFERTDAGCASCHVAPLFTNPGQAYDLGTGDGPDELLGPAFDVPSLRGLWDSAPYLHDGSAKTLRDVLVTRNRDERHGRTSQLTGSEIEDLVTYLRSL